ncbi:RNA polymerase II mediator complex subunit [Fusarium poae]
MTTQLGLALTLSVQIFEKPKSSPVIFRQIQSNPNCLQSNNITAPNSPLSSVCAPDKEGYPDPNALADYLGTATTRLLVEHYLSNLSPPWTRSIQGNAIRNQSNEEFELSFAVTETSDLRVRSTSLVDGKLARQEWTWSDDGDKESVQAIVDQEIRRISS